MTSPTSRHREWQVSTRRVGECVKCEANNRPLKPAIASSSANRDLGGGSHCSHSFIAILLLFKTRDKETPLLNTYPLIRHQVPTSVSMISPSILTHILQSSIYNTYISSFFSFRYIIRHTINSALSLPGFHSPHCTVYIRVH